MNSAVKILPPSSNYFRELDLRRRALGMSRMEVARQTGLSFSTIHRILAGQQANPSWENLVALAECLGLSIRFEPKTDAQTMREAQANAKAVKLVRMVQGTSALEAQAIDPSQREQLVRQTMHELLSGPKRRLWTG